LRECDLKVEWFSGTGKGGQNRNKTQNCCRLTHLPTGLIKTAQFRDRKSSYNNAFAELKKLIESRQKFDLDKSLKSDILSQIGAGCRGDKIRTYREQDGIVTNHLTGKKASYSRVMKGFLEDIWN
jgi:peptide chain release factor 1